MRLFNLFKKKPEYDVTNLRITDLRKDFVFDYNLSTWIVKEEYEYDWGNENFSYEFKIANEKETAFLSIEDDDELEILFGKKVKINSISQNLSQQLVKNQKPPQKINYNNKNYILENEMPGYFRNITKGENNWAEFISWMFYSDDEKTFINIEQWDQTEFEATVGKVLKEYEISNIMPAG